MKKILLLLAIVPLTAHADPHFGPEFDRDILLAALWYFLVLPLLAAQLVSWGFRQVKRRKVSSWATSIAAVLMDWLGVYIMFSGAINVSGYGLFSLSGGLYLAIFSVIGALLAATLTGQPPPASQ